LIRKLLNLRGYVGACTLSLAFLMLLIVTLTPSGAPFHNLCAFGLLSLIGFYYTMWLNMEQPNWLWPHLVLTAVILLGAGFGAYGFWQKSLILDTLVLMKVQYSFLNRIAPEIGVRYTVMPGSGQPLPTRRVVYP